MTNQLMTNQLMVRSACNTRQFYYFSIPFGLLVYVWTNQHKTVLLFLHTFWSASFFNFSIPFGLLVLCLDQSTHTFWSASFMSGQINTRQFYYFSIPFGLLVFYFSVPFGLLVLCLDQSAYLLVC